MQFIENISLNDVLVGEHYLDTERGTVLIRIQDVCTNFRPSGFGHLCVTEHHFNFEDIEEDTPGAINDEQARLIAHILLNAWRKGQSVICACMAGLCRSGAVAEAGMAIGFNDTGRTRIPNLRVKNLVMRHLDELGAFDD